MRKKLLAVMAASVLLSSAGLQAFPAYGAESLEISLALLSGNAYSESVLTAGETFSIKLHVKNLDETQGASVTPYVALCEGGKLTDVKTSALEIPLGEERLFYEGFFYFR
jgi:hypothetical protein